jgi:3,4-dihydroxy 2-butanone 4-phosphate synthase / GTP cyclohydrolase II
LIPSSGRAAESPALQEKEGIVSIHNAVGLSPISAAVEAIAAGRMAVVVDDPDRENEGDLVMAAKFVTPAAVNFMATHGRGLICVPMLAERLGELDIPPMASRSTDPKGTAFHVGVDVRGHSTGISASERAETIRSLADHSAAAADFTQPGHVFPLAYRPGGVLARAGHTEASVDLAMLAGAGPAAVICEIAGADGEMMRLPDLLAFAARHDLPVVTISDLVAHRTHDEKLVMRLSEARVPLSRGDFRVVGYRDLLDGREHLAAVMGDPAVQPPVLARVHSECLTGDVFGSTRCDCGAQLDLALEAVAAEGAGVVVYLRGHEGRGIGLLEKLNAYDLQDRGFDTVDANLALGHPADARDYAIGAQILRDLGVESLRLMTNNPAKRDALQMHGITVLETVPIVTAPTAENVRYLDAKRARMGHMLNAEMLPAASGRHA